MLEIVLLVLFIYLLVHVYTLQHTCEGLRKICGAVLSLSHVCSGAQALKGSRSALPTKDQGSVQAHETGEHPHPSPNSNHRRACLMSYSLKCHIQLKEISKAQVKQGELFMKSECRPNISRANS